MRYLVLTLALLLAVPAMAQTVYRWTDEQGNVHYGPQPPPGVEATPLRVQRQPARQQQVETAEAFAETDRDAEQEQRAELQRRMCELAREQLRAYTRSDFLYETDQATGERIVLDEDQAAAVIAQAERDVAERCADLDE